MLMVFSGFLHQHPKGEKLVSTPSATTENTLTFLEELFGSRLEPVQDGFRKHLTRYAQKGNTMVVVTSGMATFLVQRHKNLTLPVLRDPLSCPDCQR